ncbi:MAG: hypothetical protein GY845_02125 [Planctomycetes bacterium]|nr:hypothetical protein [Planctomycetota bacterium]
MTSFPISYLRPNLLLSLAFSTVLLLSHQEALANQARYAGMANNPMVEDDVDIVDFPGLLTAYSDIVFLNLMPPDTLIGPIASEGDGNLGALFGRNVALGAWIHRKPRWRDLDDLDDLFEFHAPMPTTYDLADLFVGFKAGFGMRVSLAAGLESNETRDADDKMVSTGGTAFVLDMQPGYSFDTDSYHGDFGAGLTLSTFKILEDGQKNYESKTVPSFLLRHRSIISPRSVFSGIIDVMFARRAYSMKSNSRKTLTDMGRWVLSLVAGPKLNIPGNVSVCLGTRFSLEHLHGAIDDVKQPYLNAIGVPGVIASVEVILWNLMVVRAGADYEVFWAKTEVPKSDTIIDSSGQETAGSRNSGQRFNWSTGLGFMLDDFRIDATVSQRLYFEGPQFIGGTTPGFLSIISAAYMW